MLVLAVLGAALAVSVVTGGRLRYIQNWRLKGAWLVLVTFTVQTLLFTGWAEDLIGKDFVPVVYLVTLAVLLVVVIVNRRVLGVPILLAGLILNILVISANGGRMPASAAVLTRAGRSEEAEQLQSQLRAANCVLMSDSTKLNVLGDIIAIRLGGRVGSAYSAGDLVALVGEAVVVFGSIRVKSPAEEQETHESKNAGVL